MATQVGRVEGRQRREEKTSVGGDKSGILPRTLQLGGQCESSQEGILGTAECGGGQTVAVRRQGCNVPGLAGILSDPFFPPRAVVGRRSCHCSGFSTRTNALSRLAQALQSVPLLTPFLLLSHLPPSLPLLHRYILTAFPCRTPSTTLGCGYKVVNTSLGLHGVDLLVGERDNKLLVGERLHLP